MIGKSTKWFLLFVVVLFSNSAVYCDFYRTILTDNGPVTAGATVTVNVTVADPNEECFKRKLFLIFRFEDDADVLPIHASKKVAVENCKAMFDVPFERTIDPSIYRYKINILEQILPVINIPISTVHGQLKITEGLNGQLNVFQNNKIISKNDLQTAYVSSNLEITYKVKLNTADMNYLNTNADSVTVHWFVDCVYQGSTTDYTFSTHFTHSEAQHEVLGIVVASIKPSPQSITLTTIINTTPYYPTTTPYYPTTTPYYPTTTPYYPTTTPYYPTTTPYHPTTTPNPYTTSTIPPKPIDPTTTTTTTYTTTSVNTTDTTTIITTSTTITTVTIITAVADDTFTTNSISSTPKTVVNSSSRINTTYNSECREKRPIDLLLLSTGVHFDNNTKYGYFSRSVFVVD